MMWEGACVAGWAAGWPDLGGASGAANGTNARNAPAAMLSMRRRRIRCRYSGGGMKRVDGAECGAGISTLRAARAAGGSAAALRAA